MEIIYILVGALLGFGIGWLLAKSKKNDEPKQETPEIDELTLLLNNTKEIIHEKEKEIVQLQTRIDSSISEFKKQEERIAKQEQRLEHIQATHETTRKQYETKIQELTGEIERNKSEANHLQSRKKELEEQQKELKELHEKMKTDFEGVAATLLQKNSKQFAENNEKRLGEILLPFKDSLSKFEKQVNEAYDKELRDKADLKAELKELMKLNQTISEEAKNLTTALKGDTKKQGNWGEVVLERVLEQSGLEKGREYETQVSTNNIEGKRIQPDVVIYLPENKHLIVDSKVSLIGYESFVSAETDEQRKIALKAHVTSVKNHIKQLSSKQYDTGEGLSTPDFVLLFMPIEAAFALAVQADGTLFSDAWKDKIVVVSPTTLLATLRTIASIWKQEKQTKNALLIAEEGGKLYDKIVGFVLDMEKIDRTLDQTRDAYNGAMNKLKNGRGNILNRTEKIRKLGASVSKSLPGKFIDNDHPELD